MCRYREQNDSSQSEGDWKLGEKDEGTKQKNNLIDTDSSIVITKGKKGGGVM